VITFVPTFTQEDGLGPVSTFFLAYTATAVLTRLTVGRVSDTLGRRTVILPGLVLLGTSIAALAWVHSPLALAATGLLFGLAQGVVYPTLNAFSVDQARPGQIGRMQSIYNGAFNIGTTLGSLLLGSVVHAFGHRRMFLCAAGVAIAAFVVFGIGTSASSSDR
jgi:MFS family permease